MSTVPSLERFCFVNERDPDSSISGVIDWRQGLIRLAPKGFWSVQQTMDFVAVFSGWVDRIHDSGLALTVIADMRQAPPQSQESAEILRASVTRTYHAGDRCAVVVPNSIAKLQVRRILEDESHAFFASPAAAELWAMTGKQPQRDPIDDDQRMCDARA